MTTTEQHSTRTTAIEAMQVGHRYVATFAGYEHGWLVASVEQHASTMQVLRNGEWTSVELVTVTYNNGQSITHEIGTEIAIDCDER